MAAQKVAAMKCTQAGQECGAECRTPGQLAPIRQRFTELLQYRPGVYYLQQPGKKNMAPREVGGGTSDERMIYAAQTRCMYAPLANEQEGCSGCAAWCWGAGAEGKRQGMFNRLV